MIKENKLTYNEKIKITSCDYNESAVDLQEINIIVRKKRQEIIAFILKELRNIKNLTQFEIAKEINIAQNQYQRYETGKTMPSIEILIRIAEIYKVSLDYISGRYLENEIHKKDETYKTEEKLYKTNTENKEDKLKMQIYIKELQLIYAKLEATYIVDIENEELLEEKE